MDDVLVTRRLKSRAAVGGREMPAGDPVLSRSEAPYTLYCTLPGGAE